MGVVGPECCLRGHPCRWFQNIILANRACGGGIVAWKGTNLTDAPGNRYGAYVADSQIIRVGIMYCHCHYVLSNSIVPQSPDANATTVTAGLCYLGEDPWIGLLCTLNN